MDFTIIGIARGLNKEQLMPAFEAAIKGGITKLEITMNTDGAGGLIKTASDHFKNKADIGAGTVLTIREMKNALKSGARFIVSPNVNKKIIQYCRKNKIDVYPGALTPTEIYEAWTDGATMVKVFPADCMGGADYIKAVKGPFNNIKLLACNGVNHENFLDFINKGTDGIALGASLFNKEWINKNQYDKITEYALKFTGQIKNIKK